MSAIFGLPERYIEREVTVDEMVGTWHITPESETDVNEWRDQFPDWGISAPWKAITLNNDGSCNVTLEVDWLRKMYVNDVTQNEMTSCSWVLAMDKNLSDKMSPVIELDFEFSNNYGMRYSLFLFEENGDLIMWDFIGDPDDFRPQDFVKVSQ